MQVNVLKLTVEDLEKERDFYFGKLRNIELICQENEGENNPVLQRIVDILYATDVRVDMRMFSCHLPPEKINFIWLVSADSVLMLVCSSVAVIKRLEL